VYSNYFVNFFALGFWFDKGAVSRRLTCNDKGNWDPVSPETLQCKPVYCDPITVINGATYIGSDNSGGAKVK